jgi:hypothetical protein
MPKVKAVLKGKKEKKGLEQFLKEVEMRAYEFFLERREKEIQGDDLMDWLRAEKEIKEKYFI